MDRFNNVRERVAPNLNVARFMSRIYSWMTFGLFITAVTGFMIGTNGVWMQVLMMNRGLFTFAIILQFGLVFGLSLGINRMSVGVATGCFLLYSFISGITFSTIFLAYNLNVIGQVFAVTAGTFGAMALFGYVTKKDLSAMGTFLIMGLFGIIIASVVNIFTHSAGLDFIISVLGVIIFAGLTSYDVQKLKNFGATADIDSDSGHKVAVMGALTLYLDFINLFLMLLRLFGGGGGGRSRD